MKILTRYILREFSKPFFIALLLITVVVTTFQIFTDIHLITDYKPSFWVTLKYFFLRSPSLIIRIVPIAMLLAVLFSFSRLAKNNELMAMRAGGVTIFLVAAPLFLAGLVMSGLTFWFNESIVPKVLKIERHTKYVEIQKQPEPTASRTRQNISMMGTGNDLYHIADFDGATDTMTDVLILRFGTDKKLKARLDAKSAKYEEGRWVFYDGYLRSFNAADDEIESTPFDRMPLVLPEIPDDFLKEHKEPQELSLSELSAYIRQLRSNGDDYHKELVEWNSKIAVPFGCVILAVLGVPWGWRMGKYSGVIMSFVICLIVSAVYVGGMEISRSLGDSGVLSPFLSVWLMNILFAIIGPLLLIQKDR